MSIKEWIIRKLINKDILASLLSDYPDIVNEYVGMNMEYLTSYYMSKQHVNCRCLYQPFDTEDIN